MANRNQVPEIRIQRRLSDRNLLPMFNWQAHFYDKIPIEK